MGKILSLVSEHRAHPSQDVNWALYGFGPNTTTTSGKSVNENTAQNLTIVYACIRKLAVTVGSLPVHVYRKVDEKKRERATDFPLYKIISKRPNPEMSSLVFRELLMVHLNSWGNFYAQIIRNESYEVESLWPLRPDKMDVERLNGQVIYRYRQDTGKESLFTKHDIFHVPGWGFDGLKGYSPIAKNMESIGLAMAAEEFGARFFSNDARPGIVLTHPGELSQPAQERLKENWTRMHQGLENKHKVGILEEGMDLKTIGIPPNEAQWIELRRMQIEEVARIYDIPPPLIGDLTRSTFNNIEELTRHFAIHTIRPLLVRIESCMAFQLMSEEEQDEYYVEHIMDALMRADIAARYAAYAVGRQWGFMSANDVLAKENENPLEEGGDIYLIPANMNNAADVAAGKVPPANLQEQFKDNKETEKRDLNWPAIPASTFERLEAIQERHFDLVRDNISRVVNKEVLAIEKSLDRLLNKRGKGEFDLWLEDFYSKLPEQIVQQFRNVYKVYGQSTYAEIKAVLAPESLFTENVIDRFLNEYTEFFAQRYVGRSQGQIREIFAINSPNDWFKLIDERIKEWASKKADQLAEEEIHRLSNAVSREGYKVHGVKRVIWKRSTSDSCPFCTRLNGKAVGIEQAFTDNSHALDDGSGHWIKFRGPKFHPPIHKGCKCQLVPLFN